MSGQQSTTGSLKSIAPLLRLNPQATISYQAQLRSRLIDAIESGVLTAGSRLPSSRSLSRELGVARNTVMLAYQHLVAEGHLVSRERSGIFVADRKLPDRLFTEAVVGSSEPRPVAEASRHLKQVLPHSSSFRSPPDWQQYLYPFLEGSYDRSLFPVAEWREASRMALGVNEVADWSTDIGEADDEMLIDEIRKKLLPRRGIKAARDEVLITVGEQQALYLISMLFADKGTRAVVEDPGLPEIRELLKLRGAHLDYAPVDDNGLSVEGIPAPCDLLHVSPSRQRPTGVTLSMERRQAILERAQADGFVIIEDDFECEMNYLHKAVPSIYSLDDSGRVIYVASLSKVLAPGVRLGFLVGPPDVIAAARRLRNLTTRRPSPNNQRTAAFFLSLGHYDTMLMRLTKVYEERLIALRDALNHYRPLSIAIPPVAGGTSYWVKGPEGFNAPEFIKKAEASGLLIEPSSAYFADPVAHANMFRLGVTSLPVERIRPGVEQLSRLITEYAASTSGDGAKSTAPVLNGAEILSSLSGRRLLYKTVYGEPCTIDLRDDGTMAGRAGYANEDRDTGRWWVEGDYWGRQWASWAYGEPAEFRVRIDGNQLYWLGEDGAVVDSAIIAAGDEAI